MLCTIGDDSMQQHISCLELDIKRKCICPLGEMEAIREWIV